MDPSFDFFRYPTGQFIPKTPHAALRAYEAGLLPVEIFVHKSCSTKPLDEEPYDIDEIERLLSRPNLGIQTNLILIGIFEKLIYSSNQETALFAAESINIIENRYNEQIQELRYEIKKNPRNPDLHSEIARLFFEMGLLNDSRESIKSFYLREAYNHLKVTGLIRDLSGDELNTLVRTLLILRMYDQARKVLEHLDNQKSRLSLFLKAELEFALGNFYKVFELCFELKKFSHLMDERETEVLDYWMGAS